MHIHLKLRYILAAITAPLAISVAVLCFYQWKLQREARSLLADVTALHPGNSSAADTERVLSHWRKLLIKNDCEKDSCEYWFEIRNDVLAYLHLEPPAMFRAGFTLKNGTVTRIGAWLSRSMPIYPSFGATAAAANEYVECPKSYARCGHYAFPTPVGKPYLRVMLDSQASAQQRQHAFAFSFRCLTKIGGGCDVPCDYLPLAWNDWKTDLQRGGFPMDQFDQVYRRQEHCK